MLVIYTHAEHAGRQQTIAAANVQPVVAAVAAKSARTITLLAVAQRDGLNHGKSWTCGEREIETMGACPSWDGMQVCYVYAN
jgi:hypothetical protein